MAPASEARGGPGAVASWFGGSGAGGAGAGFFWDASGGRSFGRALAPETRTVSPGLVVGTPWVPSASSHRLRSTAYPSEARVASEQARSRRLPEVPRAASTAIAR